MDETVPYMLIDEIRTEIKSMIEVLKLLGGESVRWIISIFNKIYICGKICSDLFSILPKTSGTKKCEDCGTISLLNIESIETYKHLHNLVSDSRYKRSHI